MGGERAGKDSTCTRGLDGLIDDGERPLTRRGVDGAGCLHLLLCVAVVQRRATL
jgi:hypothetical protein